MAEESIRSLLNGINDVDVAMNAVNPKKGQNDIDDEKGKREKSSKSRYVGNSMIWDPPAPTPHYIGSLSGCLVRY